MTLFDKIALGPNHCCGIGSNKKLYSWGNNTVHNRLGLKDNVANK